MDPFSQVEMNRRILSYLSSLPFPCNPNLAMLDLAPLVSKPAPPKLAVHPTTLLTGGMGDVIVYAAVLSW